MGAGNIITQLRADTGNRLGRNKEATTKSPRGYHRKCEVYEAPSTETSEQWQLGSLTLLPCYSIIQTLALTHTPARCGNERTKTARLRNVLNRNKTRNRVGWGH